MAAPRGSLSSNEKSSMKVEASSQRFASSPLLLNRLCWHMGTLWETMSLMRLDFFEIVSNASHWDAGLLESVRSST